MVAIISTEAGGKRVPMSYEEYLALGEDVHAEWVNGEITVFMPASNKHQAIVGFLHVLLDLFVNLGSLGIIRLAPFQMRVRLCGNCPGRRGALSIPSPARFLVPAGMVMARPAAESAIGDFRNRTRSGS